MHELTLDTDIGTDVDDLMTLAMSDGITSLERHDEGQHRVVVDLDTTVVAQEVLSRISRAQSGQHVRAT